MPAMRSAVPAMPVSDIEAALRFYEGVLGMAVSFREEGFVLLQCDTVEITLWLAGDKSWREGRDGPPLQSGAESFLAGTASCRVHVTDVADFHARCGAAEALHPNGPLGDRPWGMREFAALDPDGNLLTFYEPAAGLPPLG
ncbi:MAG: VOC family protein [Pseudomonadota bacterium]